MAADGVYARLFRLQATGYQAGLDDDRGDTPARDVTP
jgi:hypothetical protein